MCVFVPAINIIIFKINILLLVGSLFCWDTKGKGPFRGATEGRGILLIMDYGFQRPNGRIWVVKGSQVRCGQRSKG